MTSARGIQYQKHVFQKLSRFEQFAENIFTCSDSDLFHLPLWFSCIYVGFPDTLVRCRVRVTDRKRCVLMLFGLMANTVKLFWKLYVSIPPSLFINSPGITSEPLHWLAWLAWLLSMTRCRLPSVQWHEKKTVPSRNCSQRVTGSRFLEKRDTAVEFFVHVRAKAEAGDIFKSLTKVIQAIALKVSGKMCIYYIGVNCPYMRFNSVTLPGEVNEIPEVKSFCASMWSIDAFWYLVKHEILSKFSGVRVYILLQLYFCTIRLHPVII